MIRLWRWWLASGVLLVALAGVVSGVLPRANLSAPALRAPATVARSTAAVDLAAAAQASHRYLGDATAGAAADAGGWPNLFGPHLNSISTEEGITATWPEAGPPLLWRTAVGEGYSSPVLLGDDLVVFHRPHRTALAATTNGSTTEPTAEPRGEHSADPGPDEVLTCFDCATGEPRWEFRHPTKYRCVTHYSSGPYSTSILDRDCVFACGTEGNLYCLRRSDGSLVWKRELSREFGLKPRGYFPVTGSPLLVGERLILNLGASQAQAGIVAVNRTTGETLWTATDHGASYATPCAATIHGRTLVFVFTAEGLVALDPQSGREYWQVPFRANNPQLVNATSPIVHDDIVFTSGYGVGNLCLQVQPDGSYRELWRDHRRDLDSQYNPLTCIDGFVYGFAALDNTLRCLDLRTGKLQWKGLRELDRGAMVAAAGHFFILGTQGRLAAVRIDPHRLEVVAQTKQPLIEAPAYSFPALHRGRLFLRNQTEVLCFDLRAAGQP